MRLTSATCQSVAILSQLAGAGPGLCTIAGLAASCRVPESRIAKLIPRLAAAGYVDAKRGFHGGLRLGMPLDRIPLGTLTRVVEHDLHVAECFDPLHNQCRMAPDCRLKGLLQAAVAAFLQRLDAVTVADVSD